MCRLERGDDLCAPNRGEGVEEFLDCVTSLEIIDQVSEWDSGTVKHRGAAENLRVAVNDLGAIARGFLTFHKPSHD